jgi:type IV pilus assembly protein PilC
VTDHYQLALFHRTLAELCRCEMPLGSAFRMLEKDLRAGPLRDAATALAAEVEQGTPLAEAYRKHAGAFPPLYSSLVEAGVASGDLAGTLDEVARIGFLKAEATSRIRRVSTYPLVVLGFTLVLLWFLFRYIVPQFDSIFSQIVDKRGAPLELPVITRLVLGADHIVPITLAALAVIALGIAYLRDPIDGIRAPLGLWMRLPVVGPLRLNAALAIFASTLSVLVKRGLPLDRSLDLVAASSDSPEVRRAATAMAASARSGSSLTDAARDSGLLPPSMLWLLGSAEKQGFTPRALDDIAAICRDRVLGVLDTYSVLVEPALLGFLGVIVGGVVMAVFYPILKLQSALM